jgi:hypothetical protein
LLTKIQISGVDYYLFIMGMMVIILIEVEEQPGLL